MGAVATERVVMLKTLRCRVRVVWVYRKIQWVALVTTDRDVSVEQSLPRTLGRAVEGRLEEDAELREQNQALRRGNLVLKARLQRFEALEAENMRLRDLLGSSFKIGDRGSSPS